MEKIVLQEPTKIFKSSKVPWFLQLLLLFYLYDAPIQSLLNGRKPCLAGHDWQEAQQRAFKKLTLLPPLSSVITILPYPYD
jgi:hypothetical protein